MMEMKWDNAVGLLSEAFGRGDERAGCLVWWVAPIDRKGAPCPIFASRDGDRATVWAGSPRVFPEVKHPVGDRIELLDIIQGARRLTRCA